MTSRGITNEVYYAAQKAARFIGTPHIDNSARLCHAASTAAMTTTLGYGASTCSYCDWLDADLIVLFGSNAANNQPVATKYLHDAKKSGAEIAVVNPYREPGLEILGAVDCVKRHVRQHLADHWVAVHTGGDLAFLVGTLRALIEIGGVDAPFVPHHGLQEARTARWREWESSSRRAASRAEMLAFARLLVNAECRVHLVDGPHPARHGVDTIKALVNVGLARGLPGRPRPRSIRGHSGVQGGAEVGCPPVVDTVTAARWSDVWEFPVAARGLDGARNDRPRRRRRRRRVLERRWKFSRNIARTAQSRRALARPLLRIHHDIVLSSSMLADSDGDVLLLPATTRYESEGGGTETSTERRIIFSPEIPGRRIGSARPEWWVFGEVMARVHPKRANYIRFDSAAAIRSEIARAIPLYKGIETLGAKGDQVQWGGPALYADGRFATPDGRAHFRRLRRGRGARAEPDGRSPSSLDPSRKQFNSMIQREIDPLTGASETTCSSARPMLCG